MDSIYVLVYFVNAPTVYSHSKTDLPTTEHTCAFALYAYIHTYTYLYELMTYIHKLYFISCTFVPGCSLLCTQLDFYAKHLSIPRGIAKTRALMENLFCIIACCCTRTPLIIVGAPGSSKTLSFNLALSNLKGAESKM